MAISGAHRTRRVYRTLSIFEMAAPDKRQGSTAEEFLNLKAYILSGAQTPIFVDMNADGLYEVQYPEGWRYLMALRSCGRTEISVYLI